MYYNESEKYSNADFDTKILNKDLEKNEVSLIALKNINKDVKILNKTKLTNAAYLCFCTKNRYFPQAVVKGARFKGSTMTTIIDMQEFDAGLVNIPAQIIDFVKRHISMNVIISGKAARDEIWEYPLEALREAIINAIVHRDYSDAGNVQIRIFDTKIEIWSPGFLPKELDISKLPSESRSIPKNRLIASVFKYKNLIESWGSGFQRMFDACKKNNIKSPSLEQKAGAFVITFYKNISSGIVSSEKSSEKILDFIKENNKISAQELADLLGLSSRAVEKHLARLKKEGFLERVGSAKSGYWKILK
jgi:ATP-dependent DNA helicase RecG